MLGWNLIYTYSFACTWLDIIIIMAGSSSAALLLGRQFKHMQTDKDIPGISCGLVNNNVFEWEVMLMLDDEAGLFGAFFSMSRGY